MKCVRIIGQGVPVRLTDAEAAEIIRMGDGEYCSKAFWREWYDNNPPGHNTRTYGPMKWPSDYVPVTRGNPLGTFHVYAAIREGGRSHLQGRL